MLLDDNTILLWSRYGMPPFQFGGIRRSCSGDVAWTRSPLSSPLRSEMGFQSRSTCGGGARLARAADMGTEFIRQRLEQESFARRIFPVNTTPLEAPVEVPITSGELRSSINQDWVRRIQRRDEEDT